MRALMFFLALLAVLAPSSPSRAQDVTVVSPEELRNTFKRNGVPEGKRTALIFLPGILGSKLVDASTKDIVWGSNKFNDARLLYEGKSLDAQTFDELELPVLIARINISVYGNALRQLSATSAILKSDLFTFSYDWRQSNYLSADNFDQFLCQNKGNLRDKNLLFVAHSMGGLVLKSWFVKYYDENKSCLQDQGQTPNIKRVVFVGTPHYGSPKIVKSLFDGYSMVPIRPANSFVTRGINNFGFSFESLYELLPVQNNPECRADLQNLNLESSIFDDSLTGDAFIDLFDIKNYRQWNLPRLMDNSKRVEFYEKKLPDILQRAKIINCALATYQFPKLGRDKVVTYFGMTSAKNTDLHYVLATSSASVDVNWFSSSPLPTQIDVKKTGLDFGDGTVTKSAASWNAVVHKPENRRPCPSSHGELMDDIEVHSYLFDLLQEPVVQELLEIRQAKPEAYNKIIADLAKDRKLVWGMPTISGNGDISVDANRDILARVDMRGRTIWEVATSSSADSLAKVVINDVIIKSGDTSILHQLYAGNNKGYQLYGMGYRTEAEDSLNLTINLWDEQASGVPRFATGRDAAAKAYNTLGVIKMNNADFAGAKNAWTSASELGNPLALDNLAVVPAMPGT